MLQIFAVKDIKADMFNAPFFQRNQVVAIRAFQLEVNRADAGNLLHNNPEDFTLYFLGNFDEERGVIHPETPAVVTTAAKVHNRNKENR